MKLSDFISRFSDLNESEFRERFSHPFLLEDDENVEGDRRIFLVRGGKNRPLIVGSGSRCHIPVRDEGVERNHASLIPPTEKDGAWQITDHGGTAVNDAVLEVDVPSPLPDGARIRFGANSWFYFHALESFLGEFDGLRIRGGRSAFGTRKTTRQTDMMRTVVVENRGSSKKVVLDASADLGGELLLICDPLDPYPLEVGKTVILGRSEKHAQMILPDNLASRRHAEVERRSDGIYVRDLGSSNGTYVGQDKIGVNWVRLELGKAFTIGSHDICVLGPQTGVHKKLGDVTSGKLEETPLLELLQRVEQERLTGFITIEAQVSGNIGFERGEPRDSSTSAGETGRDAVRQLLLLKKGSYTLSVGQWSGVGNIDASFAELLKEHLTGSGVR